MSTTDTSGPAVEGWSSNATLDQIAERLSVARSVVILTHGKPAIYDVPVIRIQSESI
ncbi:MAG: hypothetical protein ACNA8P_12835 [Phycisphaerales bacterium]